MAGAVHASRRLVAMTREAKMKELQMLDAARRKFMNFTQQQKEAELARLDDEIRQKVSDAAAAHVLCCVHPLTSAGLSRLLFFLLH